MLPFRQRLLAAWSHAARRWEDLRADVEARAGLLTWNPQLYGLPVYERFAAHYAPAAPGALLALGLNPGKYGMSQTGIPFTDVTAARTQLPALGFDLDAPGLAPPSLRPFLKPYCVERSSQSVYAFLRLAYGSAEAGWPDFYAVSPCSLLFLDERGGNVTPADARLARIPEVQDLRREVIERAVEACEPRAVVLLGQDVARVAGDLVRALVGSDRVLVADHPVARGPGRRGPQWWAETLEKKLRHEALLPA